MVHKLAKTLGVLFVSFCIGILITVLLAPVFAHLSSVADSQSWLEVLPYSNLAFGWFIYAIPFAIIGFKIYPKPKKKN